MKRTMPTIEEAIGKTFGWLTIKEYRGKEIDGRELVMATCQCGNEVVRPFRNIFISTKATCLECKAKNIAKRRTSHGLSETPEYRAWCMMKTRCYNPNRRDYKWYGGEGKIVCDRWLHGEDGLSGFQCFYKDMGPMPGPGYTIERRKSSGNYEPSNCYWLIAERQNDNKRSNVKVTFRDETLHMSAMCRKYGIALSAFRERMKLGWTLEDALLKPSVPRKKIGKFEFRGEMTSFPELAKKYGIQYHTLLTRVQRGIPIEEALILPVK